jgi:hypothetical protein
MQCTVKHCRDNNKRKAANMIAAMGVPEEAVFLALLLA